MSRVSVFAKNSKWAYFGKILGQFLSLIASIIIIRELPVHTFGEYSVVLTALALANMLSLAAIVSINNRFVPEFLEHGYLKQFERLLFTGLIISGAVLLIIASAAIFFRNDISRLLNAPFFSEWKYYIILLLGASYYKTVVESILKNMLLNKWLAINTIIAGVIRPILYLMYLNMLSLTLLICIEIAIFTLNGVLGMFAILYEYRILKKRIRIKHGRMLKKRVIRYGVYSSLNEIGIGVVGQAYDGFIIAALSSTYMVGIYSVAQRINSIVYQVIPISEIQNILSNLYFRKYSHRTQSGLSQDILFSLVVKILLVVHILPLVVFIIHGQEIISEVFGEKYSESYLVGIILIATSGVLSYFYPQSILINHHERMDIALRSKVVVVVSIVGGIIAMKYFGIIGMATSTLLGTIISHLYMYLKMRQTYIVPYTIDQVKRVITYFALLGLVFFLFKHLCSELLDYKIQIIIMILINIFTFKYFEPFNLDELHVIESFQKTFKRNINIKWFLSNISAHKGKNISG